MRPFLPIQGAAVTDQEFETELAAELAAIPADHDPRVYYAGCEPSLREIFAAPVVADGVRGDTLIDD